MRTDIRKQKNVSKDIKNSVAVLEKVVEVILYKMRTKKTNNRIIKPREGNFSKIFQNLRSKV